MLKRGEGTKAETAAPWEHSWREMVQKRLYGEGNTSPKIMAAIHVHPSCSPCSGGQECFGRKVVQPRRSPHAAGTGRRAWTGRSRDGERGVQSHSEAGQTGCP